MTTLPEQQKNLPSTTTAAQDAHSLWQRQINMVWELTQAAIAIMVVIGAISGVFYFGGKTDVPPLLANAFFLIVGFYFGRTNHTRPGGVQIGVR